MNVRARIAAAVSILTVLTVSGSVHAQFSPPTCVPPNCNPEVIQNIAITGTAQSASINITGSGKMGGTFQNGANAPVLTLASENLYYGNVGGTSVNASLMLLQFGSADRLRVTLAGQMQLPLGSVGAPSYSFIGDTNTGFYSTGADSIGMATNGVIRTTTNNSGMTLNSGVLSLPAGTNAAPSLTFTGDTNTGIFRGTADTLSFVTNGQTNMTVSATNNVVITNGLTVNGTFTSSGGLSGNGSGLTNLNASNITTGTLADARLSSNVPLLNGTQTFTGANTFSNAGNSFTGSGAGLTSLNASNLSSGTVPVGRLPANLAYTDASQTFSGANTFSGMTSFGSATLVSGAGQNVLYGVYDVTSTGNLLLLQTENTGVYVDRFRVNGAGDTTVGGTLTANAYSGNGSGLTSLNATQLSGGAIPSAVLFGTYTGAITLSNASNSFTGVGTGLTALNASNLTSGTVPSARISGTYSNALTFSGANSYTNRSSFGSATLVVAAGQNLLYGNVDTTSAGNLLLLQNESVDRFRVDAAGNVYVSGTIASTGTMTSNGQNVCVQDGTNCPPTLNGAGTADYITKFTGTGSTVGNSLIYEDTANGRLGIGTTTPGSTFEVRNGNIGTYSGSIAASFGSVTAYLVAAGGAAMSGQAVGVGSIGVTGVGGSYGIYGSGDYGGYFVGNDNFGGAGVYAEWTGTGSGGGVRGYTTRPAAWGGWFEATDSTNSMTRGLYAAAPDTSGGKALWVAGDALITSDLNVTGNETIGGVSTEAYNVITNYAQITGQAGDAASGAGRLSYNTTTGKFRCNEGGTWVNCVTTGITGSGTVNYIPKFTSGTTVGNSNMTESGGTVTLTGAGSYGLYVAGAPSWGVYSATPIEANGTTFAIQGTATSGGAGGVHGTAQGAGIVYGVVGNTTASTDVNSAGVYGSGKNGVFGYSNIAGGQGVYATANTIASVAVRATMSGVGDAGTLGGNTFGVLASNLSTGGQTNHGINAQATGASAGTNIAAYFNAQGAANNYALVTYAGNVGFGEQTPVNPVVVGSDGSAANVALAIGLGDDSNTGFYHPSADTLSLATNGVERLQVNSLGNVGIGMSPAYKLDMTGDLRVSSTIGAGGFAPSGGTHGIMAGGSVYGVYGSGNNAGAYFTDADGTSYGVVGLSNYGFYTPYDGYYGGEVGFGIGPDPASKIYAYGGGDAYAYIARDAGTGNGKGIMAYGQYYGGYFRDTDSVATMYAAWGGYGTYGLGSTAGGYFSGTAGGASVYVGYGSSYGLYVGSGNTYGVYAYGNSTAGRFYDVDGTATTFIAGASWAVEIITGGAYKPSGQWTNPSDVRLKKDISEFEDGLAVVRKLNPKNFTFNGLGGSQDGLKSQGFIAQEVKDIVPYMIGTRKAKLHPDDIEETDILTIDQSALPLVLLNAIKEIDLRIEGFEAKIEKIDEIDAKVRQLEERVKLLESEIETLKD